MANKLMRRQILFYVIASLLTLPICGLGQIKPKVPVAPDMLFAIGGEDANVSASNMKVDPQGNTYVTGFFSDRYNALDFDPSEGETKLGMEYSSFIAKYSAAGALVWVKPFTGEGYGLDIDRTGNLTIIGRRASPIVRPDNANGYADAFVRHLDKDGNLLWEKLIESGTKDIPIDPDRVRLYQDAQTGYKVSSDDAGNLIGAFSFGGSPDVGGIITAKGTYDGLVVKYDSNGNVLWKFNLGSTGTFNNTALEALVDKENNIIVAGYTDGTVDYNPLGTPVIVTADNTIFIAKYNASGILQWIKTINVNTTRNNIRLVLDGQNNVYINGSSSNTIDFGVPPILTTRSSQDLFIAKYSSGGNLLYHRSMGSEGTTMLNSGITTGSDNSLYLTGSFNGTVDVDPSAAVAQLKSTNTANMYLIKYDDNGNYQWSFTLPGFSYLPNLLNLTYAGDIVRVGAQNIYVDSSDKIFVNGVFASTINFNGTGCGINSLTAKNINNPAGKFNDMFVVRYAPTLEIPVTNNTATEPVATDICPNVDPGLIIGSTPVGSDFTYQWQESLDNRTFTDISDAVSRDFDPPVPDATTYYRRRLVTSECAVLNVSNVITITLLKAATSNTITATTETSICNTGDVGVLLGSFPEAVGKVDYQWQLSTDNVNFTDITGATRRDYDPPIITTTTSYRRLITNIPCNIGTPSDTVTINVVYVPVPTVSAEQTVCVGNDVTLIATGGIRYAWSPALGLSATDVASPIANPTTTTNYTVTVFNGNCITTLQVRVVVVPKPTVNAGADIEITKGGKAQLNAQITDIEGATYSWAPATYLDNTGIANPVASPNASITYKLTVKSANGCFTVSDDVVVNVREQFVIPNVFTPNGDGINDVLAIPGLDTYKQSILTIYNRNGQSIFTSLAHQKPWDGTHSGKPLPVGIYYYVIELNDFEHRRLSGYISLMK
ncbi:MAG: gliding motility-associated C-terminal domain-containing protein [Bacteroidota bacterium]